MKKNNRDQILLKQSIELKKIGFFGGCFNPPTKVHINLANALIKSGLVDKVIFVPVGDYYNKQNLVSANHRYNMLKLLCNNNKFLDVENIASIHSNILYATDTFKKIYDKYNELAQIYFIMGSDNFKKMPTWKDYNRIITQYKFIVIQRFEDEEQIKKDNVLYYTPEQIQNMNSTQIREMIKQHQNVEEFLEMQELQYIKRNKLYINYKQ